MNAVERQTLEERRAAFRALLLRPLLLPEHPAFPLVRRHAAWLSEWLGRHPRWGLTLKPDYARLRKTPGHLGDATRPARDPKSEIPFTRRRYVFWCLLLATLERGERQTTLGRLVEGLAGELVAAGLDALVLESRDDRRDLVHVVRLLVDLGALRRVVGDEGGFVDDTGRDALYNVHHPLLAALLDVRTPPSLVAGGEDRVEALVREPAPDTEAARNLAIRTLLYRRLLDDPVVYYADLADDARAYFARQRPFMVREVEAATGLVAEARAEGIAMVDPEAELTDAAMPEEGTEGHLALLLAEWLARRSGPVGIGAVEARVRALAEEHAAHWRKASRAPGADVILARDAVDRLEALGLLARGVDAVVALPALARFRSGRPRTMRLFPEAL